MNDGKIDAKVLLNLSNLDDSLDDLLAQLQPEFIKQSKIAIFNQAKVLSAFNQCRLSSSHFKDETGYGIDNWSRTLVDDVYAKLFKAQKACVRLSFVSGTHAIATAIQANVKSGFNIISLTGRLYDSLDPVIGHYKEHKASLKNQGVNYYEFDFSNAKNITGSLDSLKELLKGNCFIYIQKSQGYSTKRKSISNYKIANLIDMVKSYSSQAIVFVDNCYGELVEEIEPIEVGANLVAGSLIKNLGGGLAISGGYIAGDAELVENCLTRITAPGIDGNQGINFNQTRLLLQGLFMAPQIVSNAVNCARVFALAFSKLGYTVIPSPMDQRYDIIQSIVLNNEKLLVKFCQKLQSLCPVDSFVQPEPAVLPGYADSVIMAGGGFVDGSTLELSADGPLREPYAVYLQGGLSWPHCQLTLQEILKSDFWVNEKAKN